MHALRGWHTHVRQLDRARRVSLVLVSWWRVNVSLVDRGEVPLRLLVVGMCVVHLFLRILLITLLVGDVIAVPGCVFGILQLAHVILCLRVLKREGELARRVRPRVALSYPGPVSVADSGMRVGGGIGGMLVAVVAASGYRGC